MGSEHLWTIDHNVHATRALAATGTPVTMRLQYFAEMEISPLPQGFFAWVTGDDR